MNSSGNAVGRWARAAVLGAWMIGAAVTTSSGGAWGQVHQPGAASTKPIVSVDFPGGTVAEYVDLLRRTKSQVNAQEALPVNVVFSKETGEQMIGAIRLEGAELQDAIGAIEFAVEGRKGEWQIGTLSMGGPRDPQGPQSFRIMYRPYESNMEARAALQGQSVRVFSLQSLLSDAGTQGLKSQSEVILTAIEAGLKLDALWEASPAVMKYHEDSGLLFARATKEQLDIVNQVILTMEKDSSIKKRVEKASKPDPEKVTQLEMNRISVRARLQESRSRMRSAESELQEVTKLHEAGNAPQKMVRDAQNELESAKIMVESATQELEILEKRLQELQAGESAPGTGAVVPEDHVTRFYTPTVSQTRNQGRDVVRGSKPQSPQDWNAKTYDEVKALVAESGEVGAHVQKATGGMTVVCSAQTHLQVLNLLRKVSSDSGLGEPFAHTIER